MGCWNNKKRPVGLEIGDLGCEWWEDGQRGRRGQSVLGVVGRGKGSGLKD